MSVVCGERHVQDFFAVVRRCLKDTAKCTIVFAKVTLWRVKVKSHCVGLAPLARNRKCVFLLLKSVTSLNDQLVNCQPLIGVMWREEWSDAGNRNERTFSCKAHR